MSGASAKNFLPSADPRNHFSFVPSTKNSFADRAAHRAWLAQQAALPRGFRVGVATLDFVPRELPKPSSMKLTLIALDQPTPDFAAVFTRNAFPGAPVIIGRQRLNEKTLGAILVNNKVSNVCVPGGVEAAEKICAATAEALGLRPTEILVSSTGVIGWELPVAAMLPAIPRAVANLESKSILPAAESIVTTDLFPKVRRFDLGGGSIVGIAKGAGMIEPNLATMLVYILTDLALPRAALRAMLPRAVDASFNCISVDSDTSTSDTVALISSGKIPCFNFEGFERGLHAVCRSLAEDVVRNGEGVRHVIRVEVTEAASPGLACALGKAIVNAPLFKCAVAGNDPNVGRLIQAMGKYIGASAPETDLRQMRAAIGGVEIFSRGGFQLNPEKEKALVEHLRAAELYASAPAVNGIFTAPIDYPPHERCVEISVSVGNGAASATVFGGDLTHEYVSENADYRS